MTHLPAMQEQLRAAVHQNAPLSHTGLLERAFSRLFHGLVYAQIWEDPVADMAALQIRPTDHMVCIASGGCNVMSYLTARPAAITAVDLSPAHVALLRLKLTAMQHLPDHDRAFDLLGRANVPGNAAMFDRFVSPRLDPDTQAYWHGARGLSRRVSMFERNIYRFGVLGRFIGAVHVVAWLARVDFRPFLAASSLAEQKAFFDEKVAPLFDRPAIRYLARRRAALFGLGIPPAQYDKLAADGDGDIVTVLRERVRKLMCDFPVSQNYFAWQAFNRGYAPGPAPSVPPYLEPAAFETVRDHAYRVRVENRSLTDLLAEAPDRSRDVYVLLDAQDWMNDTQLNALWHEITRTADKGARVLFRTGGAADILPGRVHPVLLDQWQRDGAASETAFANDRSAIYGGVHLYRRLDR